MSHKVKKNFFERFANWATNATGSSTAFILAVLSIVIWAGTGPLFQYSTTWQLIINTGTTIITFLMVFLIQKSQNKDSKAIHLKLNELIAAMQGASNRMVNIEDLTEKELDQLHKYYVRLSILAKEEDDLGCTHSIDAADDNHQLKSASFSHHRERDRKKMSAQVNKVTAPDDLEKVFAVRREVFVGEQNCPPELEWEHEDESTHFLATVNAEPAGAARWRKTDKGYKLERFAVLSKFRGHGVGQALVKAVLADLPSDAAYVYLHAQIQAVGLYEKFNFEKTGPEFEEAGIWHYKMVLAH